jgi:3-hydroxyisobutyrate dehydrogenase-like beta-hydroxyacid dehydrogenase
MVTTNADPVGVVGAGAMGLPIMRCLAKAGFRVLCWDIDLGRRNEAAAVGAEAVLSMAEMGSCRALLVFVPTDEDVHTVAEEFRSVAGPGAYIVIHSSVRTEACRALAEDLAPAGIKVVDAALIGGVRGAEAGEINLLVGGDWADVAELEEVFAPWTTHVHHLGPLGNGQIGKTVNNLIHCGQIVSIVEALSLGLELGIAPELMRPALNTGPTESRTLREIEEMRFTWYEKDIDNTVEMASAVDRTLIFSPLVQKLMRGINVANVENLLTGASVVKLPNHGVS